MGYIRIIGASLSEPHLVRTMLSLSIYIVRQTYSRPHKGQRLHMIRTIGKKLSKLVFYTLLRVLVTLERGSSIACVEMTNFAITLPFTLDVNIP